MEKTTGNLLENYLNQKKPKTATEICKELGLRPNYVSDAKNSKSLSIKRVLELALLSKDTKVSIKGIENGKEVSLNLEIKY